MNIINLRSKSQPEQVLSGRQRTAPGSSGADQTYIDLPMPADHIEIRIGDARPRRFHAELTRQLSKFARFTTTKTIEQTASLPAAVELLLDLERLVYRLRDGLGSRKDAASRLPTAAGNPNLVIDLTDVSNSVANTRCLRVHYDGEAGETSLLSALIDGEVPLIQIIDASNGVILTEGIPATDNAATLAEEAFDCVLARTITLVLAAVKGTRHHTARRGRKRNPPAISKLLRGRSKSLATTAIRRLYHLCCYAPHWRVLWRQVEGKDVWDTGSLLGSNWNVPASHLSGYAVHHTMVTSQRSGTGARNYSHLGFFAAPLAAYFCTLNTLSVENVS